MGKSSDMNNDTLTFGSTMSQNTGKWGVIGKLDLFRIVQCDTQFDIQRGNISQIDRYLETDQFVVCFFGLWDSLITEWKGKGGDVRKEINKRRKGTNKRLLSKIRELGKDEIMKVMRDEKKDVVKGNARMKEMKEPSLR